MPSFRPIRFILAPMLALAAAAACGDGTGPGAGPGPGPGPTPEPPGVPGVTVISSPATSDTIDAAPAEPLSLEVRDAQGALVRSGTVRFMTANLPPAPLCSPCSPWPGMQVSRDGTQWTSDLDVQTDANGRAALRVRFGRTAGTTHVAVSANGRALADTLEFTVRPGAPYEVVLLPPDTAVYLNQTVVLRTEIEDRHGNTPSGSPTLTSPTLEPAGGLAVKATAYGEHLVRVTQGGKWMERTVTVVPRGTLAVLINGRGNQVHVVDLNGFNYRLIELGLNVGAAGMDWTPDGSALVVGLGSHTGHALSPRFLRRVNMQGAVTPYLASEPADAFAPRFTADGQWLYFIGQSGGTVPQALRTRADGSGLEIVPNIPQAEMASPSPDGRRIAWTASRGGPLNIYDAVTGSSTPVGVEADLVAWSPAGDRLAYAKDGWLGFVAPDGSGNQVVGGSRISAEEVGGLDWSPDGEWVVYSDGAVWIRHVSTGLVMRVPGVYGVSPVWK